MKEYQELKKVPVREGRNAEEGSSARRSGTTGGGSSARKSGTAGEGSSARKSGTVGESSTAGKGGTVGESRTAVRRSGLLNIFSLLLMAAAAAVLVWIPLSKSIIVRGIDLAEPLEIRLSEPNWDANRFIKKGSSMDEGSYTWTSGKRLVFYPLSSPQEADYLLNMSVSGIFADKQRLDFVLNGESVDSRKLTGAEELQVRLHLKEGKNNLEILLPDAISPAEAKAAHDSRKLGLMLSVITIERADQPQPDSQP